MARRPLLLAAGSAVVVSGLAVAARGTARIPVAPPIVVSQAYREVADHVRPNETLSHLFARHTIGPAELLEVVTAGGPFGLEPRRIRSDLEFRFRYPVGSERPDRVSTRLSADGILLLARDSGITWSATWEDVTWSVTTHRVDGEIASSLNQAIHGAIPDTLLNFGERDRLIWSAAESVYGWVIDFTRDPRPGDEYRIAFERLESSLGDVRFGRVVASEIEVQRRANRAYVMTGENGENVYYDDSGRSMHRAFMKYPVNFRRISSSFSRRRFHPVLQRYRAHLGYDFAADLGTPIRATGDGEIRSAGRNGGYGLMVAIRHPKGIETRYAHMNRIARGIRPGVRVTQGQTIGYVGMTGLATGPHVHYEFLKNGTQINYRNVDLGDGDPVPRERAREFGDVRDRYDRYLGLSPAELVVEADGR